MILDDDDFWTFGWMTPFFVRTQTPTEETDWLGIPQCVRGLEDPHVEQAIQILNAANYVSPESKRREEYDRLWHARHPVPNP